MVNHLNEYGSSKNYTVRVQMFSLVQVRCKLDAIIVHRAKDDITLDINTMKNFRKVLKSIRECFEYRQVLLSGLVILEDGSYYDKISKINTKMASHSEGQDLFS